MAKNRERNLTVGSPMRLIIGFALPLLFGFLFQQLYNFVDTAIVGKFLGASSLAAVGSTGALNFLVLGFCMGMCSGLVIPVAQAYGARNETELRQYVCNAVYLAAGVSALFALATSLLCPFLLRWMNTPEDILPEAVSYIQFMFAAIPVTVLYNLSAGILRSLGDSRTPVLYLAMASLLNIALDLLFILTLHLGVQGAAMATVISQLASGIGCVVTMIRRFPILRMSGDDRRVRPAMIRHLFGIGAPMGLQFSITAIGSLILQVAVNGLGTVAVAAVTAGSKVSQIFSCVIDSLATTMATYAGQNTGARRVDRVRRGLRAASIIGCVYCAAAFLIVLFFGKSIISLFMDSGEATGGVVDAAYRFITINMAMYIPLLFVNIVRLTVQGMGFTRVAMLAGVFEMVARTLVAVVLVPLLGFTGACLASPAAWVAADSFLIPCYFRVSRRLEKRFAHGEPAAA